MRFELPKDKNVYLFELDDVLYPKKDYLLQVYYLFAQFVEYEESHEMAKDVVAFMKNWFETNGEESIIQKTAQHFQFSKDYSENFERLKANAKLPLPLFLFEEVKNLLNDLVDKNKKIGLLTAGNPAEQLNKIKQIKWEGLEQHLKIFFADELNFRNINVFSYLEQEYQVEKEKIFIFNHKEIE